MTNNEERALISKAQMLLAISPITAEKVRQVIEIITLLKDDDEMAHGLEDALRQRVLESIDHPLAKLALQTSAIEFARWCA